MTAVEDLIAQARTGRFADLLPELLATAGQSGGDRDEAWMAAAAAMPVPAYAIIRPRAGSFAPLRYLGKNKTAVLGLVTTKTAGLESKDELKRRIDEAAKIVPLERLALSPQCGFASTIRGNALTVDDEKKKLSLVVETAREVWGTA